MSSAVIKLKELALSGTNNLTDAETTEIAEELMRKVAVKDHKHRFKTYKNCFDGADAVNVLMKSFNILKREDAEVVGQIIMDAGFFSHISNNEAFEDEKTYFYRFNPPDVAEILKKERAVFRKSGMLKIKTLAGWSKYFFELNDTILRYKDKPKGKLKGRFNIDGATICEVKNKNKAFEVKLSKGGLTLKADEERQKMEWISVLCKTSERISESDKLLEMWNEELDPCITCMAAFAAEQARIEKERSNLHNLERVSQLGSKMELQSVQTEEEVEEEKVESKVNELMEDLLGLEVTDIMDRTLKLGSAFNSRKDTIVLALLRHFGKSASLLASLKPELDKLRIGLVAIGSGTPMMAKSFKEEFKFPGTLFVDRKRNVYKALGCNRGLKYALAGRTLKAAKQAMSEGYSQGSTQGDVLQLGGLFIISKKDGFIYEHIEEYAGDHADNDEVLKYCREYRAQSQNQK